MEAMVNRLMLSILLAAFIIGTGLLTLADHPGGGAWLAWFFWIGLGAVILLGLRLALATRQSGRS